MLAVLLAIALLIPTAPAAAKAPVDDEAQIRAAFETAFDASKPIPDRIDVIQHGKALRSALSWRDSYIALAGGEIRARVDEVQIYGDKAEVHFDFVNANEGRSVGGLVPFGVAVRRHGKWKVSEHTVCEVAAIVANGCRGQDPSEAWRTRSQGAPFPLHRGLDGEHLIIPMTFADGSSVGLRLPRELTTEKYNVRSQASLRVAGTVQAVAIVYGASHAPTLTRYGRRAELDYNGNLNFRAKRWTARVDVASLSPTERALVARELRPRVSEFGMVALETGTHLELYASTPQLGGSRARKGPRVSDHLAPVVQITPSDGRSRYGALYIAHTGCEQATLDQLAPSPYAPSRCFDDVGVELSVEGGTPDFLARLVRESSVTIVC